MRKRTKEEVVAKFVEVHGDTYDYSKGEYHGRHKNMTITCRTHGDFEMHPGNHLKGQGCPVCGDAKQAEGRRYNNEIFIEKAREVHGDTYDYSLVDYKQSDKNVIIVCRKHGPFQQTPTSHLCGSGCIKCHRENHADEQRYSITDFIEKARGVHGNRFDYSNVEYKRSSEKVSITCNIHGDFLQAPATHLQGIGCPKCADIVRADLRRKSKADFVERATQVHGDKYDYSLVEYTGHVNKVKIICREHGVFLQQPSNHQLGMGCPSCANSGFQATKPGFFYVLYAGDLTKVGVTNRLPQDRADEVSKSSGHEFAVVMSEFYNDGNKCLKTETEVLRYLNKLYKNPSSRFGGSSECFFNVDRGLLKEFILNTIESVGNKNE